MIRTSYICATAMLTLGLVACSRSSSPSTPTQDSTVQNGPSIPTQNSAGVPTTDLARDLSGVPQVFRQSVGRPDPEGTPFNRIRPQGITPVTSVIFDVVAHADDWELFMNPDTYAQVNQPNTKNVFIYTTAGDGGAGSGRVYCTRRPRSFLRGQHRPVSTLRDTHSVSVTGSVS